MHLIYCQHVHNLFIMFPKFPEICKQFGESLVPEQGNIFRRVVISLFSNLKVVVWLARDKHCEVESINFEKLPNFEYHTSQDFYCSRYELHTLCPLNGIRPFYSHSKASVYDLNHLQDIKFLYDAYSVFVNRSYKGKNVKVDLDLFQTTKIKFKYLYRLNQKHWKPLFTPFIKTQKKIQMVISKLKDQLMMLRNYAKVPVPMNYLPE